MKDGLTPLATPYSVRIEPLGVSVPIAAPTTFLAGTRAAGIELPSSCRNGTCRTCIALLTQGQAHHLIEWPGLSAEEKQEGFILPCVAVPDSDGVLQVPGAGFLEHG
jgi:ferredoxin